MLEAAPTTKTCAACRLEKPLNAFGRMGARGRHSYCRRCFAEKYPSARYPRPRKSRPSLRAVAHLSDAEIRERLSSLVAMDPNSGCWLWTRSRQSKGYGETTYRGRKLLAHRVSWTAHRGPIPSGLHVLHRCDTPCCINPDHLFLGTREDNMQDSIAKGRFARLCGEVGPNAKFTDERVAAVKRLLADGVSCQALASVLGVAKGTIAGISCGKTWADVDATPRGKQGRPLTVMAPKLKRRAA